MGTGFGYFVCSRGQRQADTQTDAIKDKLISAASDAVHRSHELLMDVTKNSFERYLDSARKDMAMTESSIKQMVHPVAQSLEKVDKKIHELEQQRAGAYAGMKEQIQALVDVQWQLRQETGNLSKALKSSQTRGRWGELQLRRVVEMAGMMAHCDFFEQVSSDSKRPDMMVQLPNGRRIVVDAKAPLSAYLDSVNETHETVRLQKLKEHADQLRRAMKSLADKTYFEQFEGSIDFVVLFLPSESIFSAALEQDPSLLEFGVDNKVLIATPLTLVALLRSVAFGWREHTIEQNALQVSKLARELYKRLSGFADNLSDLGKSLHQSVQSYNRAVGGFQSRVMVSARRFEDLNAVDGSDKIAEIEPLTDAPRSVEGGVTEEV
jgi:DNA recombination protein RmuC